MSEYIEVGGLSVANDLYDFVSNRISAFPSISSEQVWEGYAQILVDLGPTSALLLEKRGHLQSSIANWHRENGGTEPSAEAHEAFLREIGYIVDEGPDFAIETNNVDPEISEIAGPQLVVPASNARFAVNAANARWGSLYDALYGSDVIPATSGLEAGSSYNARRGELVIAYAVDFLDVAVPLNGASHKEAVAYFLESETRKGRWTLAARLADNSTVSLKEKDQFEGFHGEPAFPSTILLRHNGLYIDIQIDNDHPVGKSSKAGVKDVVLEAALTVIQDLEDSVATVDVADKVAAYDNWAKLIDGSLEVEVPKGGGQILRRLKNDRTYINTDDKELVLSGRSLMLVRNVGHLTTTNCVLDARGKETPEGFLDALITTICAAPDLFGTSKRQNSKTGSLYIVKPKMHGPEEVSLTDDLFSKVERLLGLAPNTIKIGVMDEERRTSVNLKACIRAVKKRIVFINTGFLDRTGDEIHTNLEAGPVLPKEDIKSEPWLTAYEKRNVTIGLECGFMGNAQIGKGMWPKPDELMQMVATKQAHLEAGASCAWVPSPTAAVLHAMHYHQISVRDVQTKMISAQTPPVSALLQMPLLKDRVLSDAGIQAELNNNLQGILGYVVRWIDQGIGCSKVPDINDVGLMEDRATLRISSQHVANWLYHGICNEAQVKASLTEMAGVVDEQNSADTDYRPMTVDLSRNLAFQAASDLIFEGRSQPNGYTELILHDARRRAKAADLG